MHYALSTSKRLLRYSFVYPARVTTPNERLKVARQNAGFETAVAAAEALGVPASTYIGHENGSRGFPAKRAPQYARKFKVSEEWLLYGKGDQVDDLYPSAGDLESMLVDVVNEIPATASIGEWPRLAAPILRAQLEQFRADREAHDRAAASTSPGKSSQSRQPTKPDAGA